MLTVVYLLIQENVMLLEASWKLLIGQLWITVYDTQLTTSPGKSPEYALKVSTDMSCQTLIVIDIP